ncbi:MAG: BCCT family transporter [Pseudomonadota bacterium]
MIGKVHFKREHVLPLAVGAGTLLAMLAPASFGAFMEGAAGLFLRHFDLWTIVLPTACFILCVAVAVLPQGREVIGGRYAKPQFRTVTWIAMMFAAGMGSGLVFWGAAEPLIHLNVPPPGDGVEPGSVAARRQGLAITQFHWGLHAWAIYAVSAMAIGLSFSRGGLILPSAPFVGLSRKWRRVIDWAALVAVMFGIVASLGQGVFQVSAGLRVISNGAFPSSIGTQMLFLILMTAGYLASAWLGLRRGIAILSNINMAIAALLAAYILIAGPTGTILQTLWESTVAYLGSFAELSVSLRPEGAPRDWTRAWSLTYFLWWVAWTPFVGVFLARISRGRSLRSFVAAAVIVPTAASILWFSILGGAAIAQQQAGIDLGVSDFATAPQATYVMLKGLPLTTLWQAVTMVLIVIFIITSADSGAYVLAMFSERDADPSPGMRMYWGGVLAALTAAALLARAGQDTTRALAVAGSIPLTLLLAGQGAAMAWRLFRPSKDDRVN